MVTHDTSRARGALALAASVVLVVSAAAAGVSLTAVGTASAAPTGVTACTTIVEPGAYELRANLSVLGSTCLTVEASDVTLDGNGYAVERTSPDDSSSLPPGYRESAAVLVGGTESLTNVTVTNVTVRVESLGSGEVTTRGVAFRNVSRSTLADVHLTSRVWPTVEVVGSNNTVRNVTRVRGVFEVVGDDNLLVDSVAGTGDDIRYATSITGDRNRVENLTSLGDPGLRVSGRATVVHNSTFGGIYSPPANFTDAPETRFVNNTVRSRGSVRFANSSSVVVRANTGGVVLVDSDDSEVVDNDPAYRLALFDTDGAVVRGNRVGSEGIGLYGSASNLIYDNLVRADDPVTVEARPNESVGANRWNVTPRPGENVVGGDTVAGNFYGDDDGFSRTCEDADGDGLCDSPYELAENNTDSHPLVDPIRDVPSPPLFDIVRLDVPRRVAPGETARVRMNVTNTGETAGTQTVGFRVDVDADGTPDPVGLNETMTLAPGERRNLTFAFPTAGVERGEYRYAAFTDDERVGGRLSVEDPPETNFTVTTAGTSATVVRGDTLTTTATIWNEGEATGTQTVEYRFDVDRDGTPESVGLNRTVTLARGEHRRVAFDYPTADLDPGTYVHGVFTRNSSLTFELDVREPDPPATDLSVFALDSPSVVVRGETVTAEANVSNWGDLTGTWTVEYRIDADGDGTPEPVGVNETVTLGPGESRQVAFEFPTDGLDPGTYTHGVFAADERVTADLVVAGAEATRYQVDFVAGHPIENLSADRLYAKQDRLLRFAFGVAGAGVTDRGSAWPSAEVRECVDYGHVVEENGTASVSFAVADGCSNVTLSLAVHSMPGATFSVDTVDQQELLDATTGTYGPGEHTIAVGLPDADDDSTVPAARRVAPHTSVTP
ncbi:NosD domain-containing protein [Candidatus Halobonum tyrrellensis]|uniref:Periplasmic copper-binding protein NosD beta helix domain-containing protein n=1 Tax=Candidatus Halobonum tyrrellensis G22 TaxID=1324957 RepID=V4GR66_9EURY|nr:NosD domain-containing protein [Candidatus Halobonum tyrrellensis]ESP87546.1 hypothetical protein K933_13776 [Candidatus Halobonum tyrrellensis G22]